MRRLPDEADGAGSAPTSPGLPRGTQIDQPETPQETRRASRALPPARMHESSGSRLLAPGRPSAPAGLVAEVLADAFLAAEEWAVGALAAAGYEAVGRGRSFVPLAVLAALRGYHRPPRDAPRALSALIFGADGFTDSVGASATREPIRILNRRILATAAAPTTPVGQPLDTVADLARDLDLTVSHLDWFADTKHWNRRAPEGPLQHYRYEWRMRPGRVPRLLEVPLPRLRDTQRIVLDEILAELPLHDAAHGFVGGRSAVTGAALHAGREVVIGADLSAFFAGVTAPRVYGIFRSAGLPEPVAHVLTGLCTHVVPLAVLARMPEGGSVDERFLLRKRLGMAHLPQGAPSSPALANLSLRRLDTRLDGYARAVGASYTRYADDLAFSGDGPLAARADAFVRGVGRIVASEGHLLNPAKTRVRRRGVRQSVTGVVVNDGTGPGRREYDQLKAMLHNCEVHGPASQNRAGLGDFRAHLLGRIGWVGQLAPGRGAALRASFDRVRW